ncbi:MAG: GNAT family N-acetyltransferase [Anaerolineaceae bacterium]|nr:GNAT family N-acetyltransferase [Anaerolineaceae bacterium]
MPFQPVTLEGDFVWLEPLSADHAADLAAVAEPDIFTYHFPPPEFSESGFEQLINHMKRLSNWLLFAIVWKSTGRAVGVTAFIDFSEQHRSVEIGFTWIGKAYQGTAINPEIKYLMLRHAIEEQNCLRVQIKTDSRNQHSQRAIEKLGAVREGLLRKHMVMHDGHVRDTVIYSITDDDWPGVKAGLEARLRVFSG